MSEAFRPAARLRSRGEFVAVQKSGRRVAGRFLTLLAQQNDHGRDRLGIIASRRVGNSVVRNRAKRRVREIFRRLPATAGRTLDVVAIVRTDAAKAPFDAVSADFHLALKKLRGSR
jgi:ribonuclease P protein component